jgi:hypothetical protein
MQMTKPWVKTYSGGKPNYTEPCPRCGKVNPADVHTCTPKQREWVELTNDEIDDIWAEFNDGYGIIEETLWGYERAIEAKLKEKNSTTERIIQTSDDKQAESTQGEG